MAWGGRGRRAGMGGGRITLAALRPSYPSPVGAMMADAFWGGPLATVQIPYAWVSPVVVRRPTVPVNRAVVTQDGGNTARASDTTSISVNGLSALPVTINNIGTTDPANLASFLVTYGATPQPRQPVLRINLYGFTDETQAAKVLRVGLGQRVQITGAPSSWPSAAVNFTVVGIVHTVGADIRLVDWTTAPLVGTSPSAPGPWARADVSLIQAGTDRYVY